MQTLDSNDVISRRWHCKFCAVKGSEDIFSGIYSALYGKLSFNHNYMLHEALSVMFTHCDSLSNSGKIHLGVPPHIMVIPYFLNYPTKHVILINNTVALVRFSAQRLLFTISSALRIAAVCAVLHSSTTDKTAWLRV